MSINYFLYFILKVDLVLKKILLFLLIYGWLTIKFVKISILISLTNKRDRETELLNERSWLFRPSLTSCLSVYLSISADFDFVPSHWRLVGSVDFTPNQSKSQFSNIIISWQTWLQRYYCKLRELATILNWDVVTPSSSRGKRAVSL